MTGAAAPDYPAGAERAAASGLAAGGNGVIAGDLLAGRNLSLDFFRGVMALLVAIGHFYYWNAYIKIPLSFILAVDFFLVLSGFVICHSVTRQKDKFDSISFAKKRWLRLFPVYIACVLITVPPVLWYKNLDGPNLFDMARIITISQMIPLNSGSHFPLIEPLGIAYTISAELWTGIFLFPLYSFLLTGFKNLVFPVFMLLIIWALIILNNEPGNNFMNIHHWLYGQFLDYAVIRCIFDYSIGILAYIIFSRSRNMPISAFLSSAQLVCIIAWFLIYCKFDYIRNNEFLAPFLFTFFIYLLSFKAGVVYKITATRFAAFLGDISYPAYLIHPFWIFILQLYRANVHKAYIVLLYLFVLISSAWLINRLVEKPCLKLLRK
ncbi:MAG: acyltransferase [Candidatus Tokpelaia sp.]|nr:MAG: acyltransferase [Candidatus Tokpelaia sp.]KAA6207187.1 MAG: acyltransferase [Candidatus Tokpelaia sp.]